MKSDEVKGIKEAVRNMRYHSAFSLEPAVYQVFYNIIDNEVDFLVVGWGEGLPKTAITLTTHRGPITAQTIKRALKEKEAIIYYTRGGARA